MLICPTCGKSFSTTEKSRAHVCEYPQREICAYGRYINCQILNWGAGSPPKFIVCNPLHADYREPFLAMQRLGTWMRVDLVEALHLLEDARSVAEPTEGRI